MKQRPLWIADQVRNDNLAVIPAKAGIHASNEAAAAVDCGQVRNGNLADRGRERLAPSPPSELYVRFSRIQLSSR
jgi:hypothetical protein